MSVKYLIIVMSSLANFVPSAFCKLSYSYVKILSFSLSFPTLLPLPTPLSSFPSYIWALICNL